MYKKIGGISFVLVCAVFFFGCGTNITVNSTAPKAVNSNMKLTSSAFDEKEKIPAKYTCDSDDVNPPLSISEVPEGTKSLALVIDDPDAPLKVWVHWLVWNIPPDITDIPENSLPAGSEQGATDFGNARYGGPCPTGDTAHRYQFKVYALDTMLDLKKTATVNDLNKAINGHVLDYATLTGLYIKQ